MTWQVLEELEGRVVITARRDTPLGSGTLSQGLGSCLNHVKLVISVEWRVVLHKLVLLSKLLLIGLFDDFDGRKLLLFLKPHLSVALSHSIGDAPLFRLSLC